MTIHILYPHYYDRKGLKLSVGGIQTYITELAKTFVNNGWNVLVYQSADIEFLTDLGTIKILGFRYSAKEAESRLVDECRKRIGKDDIVIFGTDLMASRIEAPSIAIQHGISWDVPDDKGNYFLKFIKKTCKAWKRIERINTVDSVICVDYNFINWIRAVSPFCKAKMIAIPNFTEIPRVRPEKPKGHLNIIFARRFFWYRGTRIFAEAIEHVLQKRKNITVTIAGEGDDEQFLRNKLEKYPNVEFIKYTSDKSLEIHSEKHIAVIPTIGSEGTSLSLLEAMAAGCAVICTNVGGMTNVVLDNYNGIMIPPDAIELEKALLNLIDDADLRERISNHAYETVREAFCIDRWRTRWLKVIEDLSLERG